MCVRAEVGFGVCGFEIEADGENWVSGPFVAEQILPLSHLRSDSICVNTCNDFCWSQFFTHFPPCLLHTCECTLSPWLLNLWPLGDFGSNSKILIVKFINIQNIRLGTHCEIAVRWMPQNITNEESSFVAWCRQATSRYLSQYWPVNRPQWVEVGIVVSFTE